MKNENIEILVEVSPGKLIPFKDFNLKEIRNYIKTQDQLNKLKFERR